MNYDFKTNWDDIILPLLNLHLVKKSIISRNIFLKSAKTDSLKTSSSYKVEN